MFLYFTKKFDCGYLLELFQLDGSDKQVPTVYILSENHDNFSSKNVTFTAVKISVV